MLQKGVFHVVMYQTLEFLGAEIEVVRVGKGVSLNWFSLKTPVFGSLSTFFNITSHKCLILSWYMYMLGLKEIYCCRDPLSAVQKHHKPPSYFRMWKVG